jgi:uncharacterized cofD-like protein
VSRRVVILGGGHGVATVLRALRDDDLELTAVVTVADDGGSSGELRRRLGGPAVGDLRRCLLALSDDDAALTLGRPVTVGDLGAHPLGNLVLVSLAEEFGDLAAASERIGRRLGICGRVLPATAEPLMLLAEGEGATLCGESAIGSAGLRVQRLRFKPARPRVPEEVGAALDAASCVVLAPGSLFTSVLAVAALPDVAARLARATARIVWVCNLEPEPGETANLSAYEHLLALRRHGVEVDACLFDPGAGLPVDAQQFAREGVVALAHPMRCGHDGVHDPELLGLALRRLLGDSSRRSVGAVVHELNAVAYRDPLGVGR